MAGAGDVGVDLSKAADSESARSWTAPNVSAIVLLLLAAFPAYSDGTAIRLSRPAAEVLELLPAPRRRDHWQPGLDYFRLPFPPYQETDTLGKVRVHLLFLYTYGRHTDNEFFRAWLKTKPNYIDLVLVPDIRWPHAREQARTYYALQALGRADLHEALYEWATDEKRSDTYHNLYFPDVDAIFHLSLEFAKSHDVSAERFTSVYWSKATADKLRIAERYAHLGGVGASTLIAGKFATSPLMTASSSQGLTTEGIYGEENMNRFLRLVEYLAASEHHRTQSLRSVK